MNAKEIVRALRDYASDCDDCSDCFYCDFACICDKFGGNAPKIIADLIGSLTAQLAQLERDNPKPLTLDELREMGKTDWVWLTFPELPSEESGWYRAEQVYATYSHKHYGETWIAYCSRPKEAANG